MADFLDEVRDGFDLVLIDCPPNLHLCSWAALVASDFLVVPLQAEDYGAQGLGPVQRSVQAGPVGAEPSADPARLPAHDVRQAARHPPGLRGDAPRDVRRPTSSPRRSRWPRTSRRPSRAASRSATTSPSRPRRRRPRRSPTSWSPASRPPRWPRPKGASHEGRRRPGRAPRRQHDGVDGGGAGRGPDPDPRAACSTVERRKYQGAARLKDALAIKLDQIVPDPNQPRKEFDPAELADLAESLKARGQLQPIRVRWDEAAGKWVIIAGERRFRAAQLAGLPTLVCIEATKPQTEDDILEDQLVENCLRDDLKPVEQARAFRTLMDRRGWSYRQLGAALNLSSAHITRSMALLNLPGDLQEQVDPGAVPASAAAEVAKIEDDAARRDLVGKIAAGELTRDETVREVRRATSRVAEIRGRKGQGGGSPSR